MRPFPTSSNTSVPCSEAVNHTMPIPTVDKLLDPLMELAATQPVITRKSATEARTERFALSPAEANQKIPSGGSTLIRNRTGWAMTYLTKGGLIEKIAPRTFRATERGTQLRAQRPNGITLADLEALDGWEAAWHPTRPITTDGVSEPAHSHTVAETTTPTEALTTYKRSVTRSRLLRRPTPTLRHTRAENRCDR